MKEPRSDFRPQEEEYFRKQDAKLIEKLREERAEKERQKALNEHRQHCTACGLETTPVAECLQNNPAHEGIWQSAHVCTGCHQVSLPFATLQKLLFNKNGRLLSQDLHDQVLVPLAKKPGRRSA